MRRHQMPALNQTEPRRLASGHPLQLSQRVFHHAALLLRQHNALGQRPQHIQSPPSRARFPKHNQ